MKRSYLWFTLSMAVAAVLAAPRAEAVALPLDGTWVIADEVEDGNGGFKFPETWTIKSEHRVELTVYDIYIAGDTFEVYLGQNLLGTVEGYNPDHDGNAWALDAKEAASLGSFSHATWLLDPGAYEISIRTLRRPRGYAKDAGGVSLRAFERQQPIPVPELGATWALLATSLACLGGLSRLHQRRLQRSAPGVPA